MTRRRVLTIVMSVAGILLLAVGYMAFLFPETSAVWEEQAAELSVFQSALVNVAELCQTVGLFILPVLAVVILGSLVLLVVPERNSEYEVPTTE